MLKGIKNIFNLGIDLLAILAPTWSHLGPKLGYLGLYNRRGIATNASQDALGSQNPSRFPKRFQNEAPKLPKWFPRPSIWDRYWRRFLDGLCTLVESILLRFFCAWNRQYRCLARLNADMNVWHGKLLKQVLLPLGSIFGIDFWTVHALE